MRGGARVVRPVHLQLCCCVALTKCYDDQVIFTLHVVLYTTRKVTLLFALNRVGSC